MSSIFYVLCGFAIFFLIFWSGKWIVHILAISYGKYKLHKKTNNIPYETPLPSVSILKPLMGVDPHLEHNLATFFTMNYPIYELLFCIEDENDPAVEIVQILREKYPNVESSLFLGGSNVGVNPKINNMHPGYQAAKYELIMISDSGIKMKEDTLLDMVGNMTEKVGLVHQMPFTCDRDGFAATFEKIFFGTIQSRIYLCADLLGINCHTGMSCLMRKSVLDKLGGLSKFGCYLAEDFFLAKSLTENGWKMRISSQPAWQNSGICDIQSFQARLCRWAKLRVAMMPTTIFLEPLSECLIVGAFASWSVGLLFSWDPLVFYLIHILMWFLSDWILLSIVQNGTLSFNKFEFVVGWAFREITGPYLFLHALYDPAIKWRTRLYKLQWGGIAYELQNDKNNENINIINNTEKIMLDNVDDFQNSINGDQLLNTQEKQPEKHQKQPKPQQQELQQQYPSFDQPKDQQNNSERQKQYEIICEQMEHQYHILSTQMQKQQENQNFLYQDYQQYQSYIAATKSNNLDSNTKNIKYKYYLNREGVASNTIVKPNNNEIICYNVDSINNSNNDSINYTSNNIINNNYNNNNDIINNSKETINNHKTQDNIDLLVKSSSRSSLSKIDNGFSSNKLINFNENVERSDTSTMINNVNCNKTLNNSSNNNRIDKIKFNNNYNDNYKDNNNNNNDNNVNINNSINSNNDNNNNDNTNNNNNNNILSGIPYITNKIHSLVVFPNYKEKS